MRLFTYLLHDEHHNAGDLLTEPILKHFGFDCVMVNRHVRGKFVGVGSVMTSVRPGDTVWGTGCIRDKPLYKPGARFLAVRGPMTRTLVTGSHVPEVYGDPGLLLPLIYNPDVELGHETGVIPHYIDKGLPHIHKGHLIDIQSDWKNVVREIKSCKKIISSSLHGLIIAEAYGVPAEWAVYSDKVIGGEFKFHDYLLGTGRRTQNPGQFPPIPNLEKIQRQLVTALRGGYKSGN